MSQSLEVKSSKRTFVYFVGLIAALAGLLFGMDTGVISGALPHLSADFHLSHMEEGLVVSILLIGAVFGTFLSNLLSDHLGRRWSIIISTILFTVGAVLSGIAPSIDFLIVVRFFLGVALGIAAYVTPLYLAEISPRRVRGGMIAAYQLMITIGLAAAFISDTIFTPYQSWRLMLGVVAVPSAIMLLFVTRLPYSPRWLMLKEKSGRARNVLNKIFSSKEADAEFKEIADSLKEVTDAISGWSMLRNRKFCLVLLLGIGAQLFQQWTGINAIMYYAPSVFKAAGFQSIEAQMWCTIAVGIVNVLTTVLAIRYVDRIGRRPILFFGLTIMTIGLAVLGYVMHLHTQAESIKFLGVVATLFYIFGFAISLGPIVWIICAEVFPLRGRDVGLLFTTTANWTFNAILAQFFPGLIGHFGSGNVFFGFAVMSFLGLLFMYRFMPETKGISLEKIEKNLFAGKRMRELGRSLKHED